jgi:fibronectin type 3 domain-containing protein
LVVFGDVIHVAGEQVLKDHMNPARRTTAVALVLAAAGGVLTVTAVPASAAVNCTSPVFKRQFFANTTFSGTPKKTDCDSAIDQDWGTGAPISGVPSNNFGVRWSVTRDFGSGGPFTFTASAQDGVRVYLDGVRKIDLWKNVSTTAKQTANVTIPSGKHTLRVDFVNWTGTANVKFAYTPRTSATVDKVKPFAPSGASVRYDTLTGKATVTWSENKEMDLSGYRVYRRLKGSSAWKKLVTTTATFHTDIPPATGEMYYYEVRAVDKAGNESSGTADQPAATVDLTGPAAPSRLTAHGDRGGMILSWNPVADAVAYELFERDDATGSYTLLRELTGTSYEHAIGASATTHTYVVRGRDAAGNNGPYSAPVTSDSLDHTAPDAPLELRAVPEPSMVTLHWKASEFPTDWELTNGGHFTLRRSKGDTLTADATKIDCVPDRSGGAPGQMAFSCEDTAWDLDTTYTYGVTLSDKWGNTSEPRTATVTTADRTPPPPLTGLTATPRADGMLLRWNKPLDDDIASYHGRVGVRREDGTVRWTGWCSAAGADALAMLCIDVPDGETLVYDVRAKDTWGNMLSLSDPSYPTVTGTEPDLTPSEYTNTGNGPLFPSSGWQHTEDITPALWDCRGTACADLTQFRVSRWNPATRSYQHLATVPATKPDTDYYFSYLDPTQPLGSISYYRVVGVYTDGTQTPAVYPYRIRPDLP